MTKKVKNIMKEKSKKVRSESKIEKEKIRKNKLSKRFKNKPAETNITSSSDNNELKQEFNKVQDEISKRPGREIKNKQKRYEIIMKRSSRKKQIKSKIRRNNQKIREEQGEEAVEKTEIKTIDNQREKDDTYIHNDEELEEEIQNDEFTSYYNNDYEPQVMITTSIRHTSTVFKFVKAIKEIIPNSFFYYRKKLNITDMITFAKEKNFTTLILITEECKRPYRITIAHLLGKGLTAEFKISDVVYRENIRGAAVPSDHNPELIFKNFKTKLGFRVQRLLNSLFPQEEELKGRRIVTFHNQRDYIFFRHHRYQFEDDLQGVRLQEAGPSFTLRLLSIQEGLFERETGNFEYNYKDKMGVNRRKFYL